MASLRLFQCIYEFVADTRVCHQNIFNIIINISRIPVDADTRGYRATIHTFKVVAEAKCVIVLLTGVGLVEAQ